MMYKGAQKDIRQEPFKAHNPKRRGLERFFEVYL